MPTKRPVLTDSKPISDATLTSLVGRDDPLIVECGAHDGRDTVRFLRLFPKCHIFAFEPDPRPINRQVPPGFKLRIKDDPRVKLVIAAVSNRNDTATLYRSSGVPPNGKVTDWDHSSSLSKPTGHLKWSPWCTFPDKLRQTVLTTMLDSQLAYVSAEVDLLWVDVQGGQNRLIEGAKHTLERTRFVYMECHQTPMYEDEPTQDNLIAAMKRHGFHLSGIYQNYNLLFGKS